MAWLGRDGSEKGTSGVSSTLRSHHSPMGEHGGNNDVCALRDVGRGKGSKNHRSPPPKNPSHREAFFGRPFRFFSAMDAKMTAVMSRLDDKLALPPRRRAYRLAARGGEHERYRGRGNRSPSQWPATPSDQLRGRHTAQLQPSSMIPFPGLILKRETIAPRIP